MSKVIYLYNQNNSCTDDNIYEIILNFFKSVSTNLIIIFFNYFFNDSLNTNDSIHINNETLNKNRNSYIPLDYSLPYVNFQINNDLIYSIGILNKPKNNFSLHLLKYNKNNCKEDYFINLPQAKILEFEDNLYTKDKLNYTVKLYNHTLSYEVPILKFSNLTSNFIKDNNLYILFPFTLFNIYHKIIHNSKIGSNTENLRKDIITFNERTYKDIKKLNQDNNSLSKKDYGIIKDTIGEIIDYYLESLYD